MKQRSRRNSDNTKLVRLTIVLVAILIVGMLLPRALAFVGMVALYPVQAAQTWFSETSMAVPALWRDKLELQDEINSLQAELAQVADPSVSERLLREDNIQLRNLLGATTSPRIAAAVITRPDQLPYDVLRIDQGREVGIEVGAPVYSSEIDVLGFVSQVYPRSALVTMISTPGFSGTAYVEDSNITVPIEGVGSGVARVLVPQGVVLRTGSLVYLPSIQPGIYGRIIYIENESTQPQQYGYITPAIGTHHLRYVAVGKPSEIATDPVVVSDYIDALSQSVSIPTLATSTASTTAKTTEVTADES